MQCRPEDDHGEVPAGQRHVVGVAPTPLALEPEAQLLLLGARAHLSQAGERELGSLAAGPIDWGALVGLATHEGTAALLHSHLRRLDVLRRLPPEPRRRLTATAHAIWGRSAVLADRWAEATAALREAGIEALTLKGMALAHSVYPNPGLRPMADIDLLVRPVERAAALATLQALGYRTPGPAADTHGASRSFAELVRDGTLIDLHWHVARYLRFEGVVEVDHDGLWRRARPLVMPAGRSLALGPEDLLLHLVLHLTLGSDFGRVLWYADIDTVVRRFATELDWDRVVAEAGRWRIRALAGWTLGVVRESFATPLPPGLLDRLGQDRLRRAAVARCVGTSSPPSLGPPLGDARVYPAQTLLMDRPADTLRVLGWTFFPSGTWLRLHYALEAAWQVPIYRAIHPLRVGWLGAKQLL